MLERKSVLTKVATETEGGALESAEANKMAMLLYFALLFDLAVLSMKVSAYVFVCIRIVSEVSLFLLALFAILLAFASGISVISHDQRAFAGIHKDLLYCIGMGINCWSISPMPALAAEVERLEELPLNPTPQCRGSEWQ